MLHEGAFGPLHLPLITTQQLKYQSKVVHMFFGYLTEYEDVIKKD
jgi:hypothetical protein